MKNREEFMFEVLKGTKDYEPKEQILVNYVIDIIKKNFELYGFRPFETPLVEYYETLTNKYEKDSEIVQEIFKVTDRGKRELGLRYDLTVPLCRFIASKKQLKLPFRRYAIGKVFRDGPIKAGRLREFIQCDADIVGLKGEEVEAETLKMFFDTYCELKIKPIIEINNNKILRGTLLQEGFKEKDLQGLILSIDKLKKIGEKGVILEIKEKKYNEEKAKKVISILNSKSFEEIKLKSKNEILLEGIKELENLTLLLNNLKVNYRINFSMSRGLNIYTGNIWEMYDKNETITSSIGSGGRYDYAIGNYIGDGKEYPAMGVSFGLIPILEIIKNKEIKEGITNTLVVPLDKELIQTAFEIANKFRLKSVKTEISYDFKLKKAFEYANFLGCENIVILGNNDVNNNEYTLKNLKTGKEIKEKIN